MKGRKLLISYYTIQSAGTHVKGINVMNSFFQERKCYNNPLEGLMKELKTPWKLCRRNGDFYNLAAYELFTQHE